MIYGTNVCTKRIVYGLLSYNIIIKCISAVSPLAPSWAPRFCTRSRRRSISSAGVLATTMMQRLYNKMEKGLNRMYMQKGCTDPKKSFIAKLKDDSLVSHLDATFQVPSPAPTTPLYIFHASNHLTIFFAASGDALCQLGSRQGRNNHVQGAAA